MQAIFILPIPPLDFFPQKVSPPKIRQKNSSPFEKEFKENLCSLTLFDLAVYCIC